MLLTVSTSTSHELHMRKVAGGGVGGEVRENLLDEKVEEKKKKVFIDHLMAFALYDKVTA